MESLQYLDYILGPITFLVGHSVSLADLAVWGVLRGEFQLLNSAVHVNIFPISANKLEDPDLKSVDLFITKLLL